MIILICAWIYCYENFLTICYLQYSTSKGTSSEDYKSLKKEYDTIETELKKLRETYNLRQDTWIKEKLSMQVRS